MQIWGKGASSDKRTGEHVFPVKMGRVAQWDELKALIEPHQYLTRAQVGRPFRGEQPFSYRDLSRNTAQIVILCLYRICRCTAMAADHSPMRQNQRPFNPLTETRSFTLFAVTSVSLHAAHSKAAAVHMLPSNMVSRTHI